MRQPNARNVKIQDLSYLVRMFRVLLTLLFLLTSVRSSLAGTTCDAVDGFDYRGAMIKKIPVSQAYFYTITRMAIDADGAPIPIIPWIKESMRWRMLAFRREIGKRFWLKIQRSPMNPSFKPVESLPVSLSRAPRYKTAVWRSPTFGATSIRRESPTSFFPGNSSNSKGRVISAMLA